MHINPETAVENSNQVISQIIKDVFARRLGDSADIDSTYRTLWNEIDRLINSGGKRLRSKIAVLSYLMFGGQSLDEITPVAASIELLHLGVLIHDDIIDRDYVRYGTDNIAGGYIQKIYTELVSNRIDRLHYANSMSVLAGDLLLSESYRLIAESAIDPQKALSILSLLGKSIFEVIGGELLDTEAVFRDRAESKIEKIAIYKTSSYTIALPMLAGAKLAGVSAEDQQRIQEFSLNLGIAFQLRDDILGVFGSEAETGKTVTGDIREAKFTYMIEQFYNLSTIEQQDEFEQYFGNQSITDDQAGRFRQLLTDAGALQKTESQIDQYETNARESLSQLPVNPDYAEKFSHLISALTNRVK